MAQRLWPNPLPVLRS